MAEQQKSSQAQQNPQTPWQKAADEAERFERQMFEHGTRALDDAAALAKGTMQYAAQLSAEWRRLSLDAVRRSTELFQR